MKGLHDVTEFFFLVTSVTVLSSGISEGHEKCCSEIRERRRAVGGRQIEHSSSKVGHSVGSKRPVCLRMSV